MKFAPSNVPAQTPQALSEYLRREFQRVANVLHDSADTIHYRGGATDPTLSAGVSANWRVGGNVLRVSTSNTVTLTGLVLGEPMNREIVLVNVGHGVVVLLPEDAASSASWRFALAETWHLSANAAAVLWYDAASRRVRGVSRT